MRKSSKFGKFKTAANKYKADNSITTPIKFTNPYISQSINQRVVCVLNSVRKAEGDTLLMEDGTYTFVPYAKSINV